MSSQVWPIEALGGRHVAIRPTCFFKFALCAGKWCIKVKDRWISYENIIHDTWLVSFPHEFGIYCQYVSVPLMACQRAYVFKWRIL